MPVLFLHGVNVRDDENYRRDLSARETLMRQLLLDPLAAMDRRYADLRIVSPYWGGLGVTHAWNQATLPAVRLLEDLGAETIVTASAFEQALVLGAVRPPSPGPLETLGAVEDGGSGPRDPEALVEAVLAPLIHSEEALPNAPGLPASDSKVISGHLEGMLLAAGRDAARNLSVKARVLAAPSDEVALDLLRAEVQARFLHRVEGTGLLPSAVSGQPQLEDLGPSWWDPLKRRVDELFDRAKDTTGRAGSVALLKAYREKLHKNIGRFLGDVFVYLLNRGTADRPGPVPKLVLDELRPALRAGEPVLAVTHSMGGNILYDLLTTFAPDLKLDAWISVGGQVGQFEEMKLFAASDPAVGTPSQVAPFGGRVRTWINVYDPADVLSFLVGPVFTDPDPGVVIRDTRFNSRTATLEAHGAYFKRPSFYDLVRTEMERRP